MSDSSAEPLLQLIKCYNDLSPVPPSPMVSPTSPDLELTRQDAFIIEKDEKQLIPYIVTDWDDDDDDLIQRDPRLDFFPMAREDEENHGQCQLDFRNDYHEAMKELRVAEWNLESMAILYDGEFVSIGVLAANKTGLDDKVVKGAIRDAERAYADMCKKYDRHFEHMKKHGVYTRLSLFDTSDVAGVAEPKKE